MECDGDGWQATTTSTAVTLKVDGIRDIVLSFSKPFRRQVVVIIAGSKTNIAYIQNAHEEKSDLIKGLFTFGRPISRTPKGKKPFNVTMNEPDIEEDDISLL